jgi:hypothetical protein
MSAPAVLIASAKLRPGEGQAFDASQVRHNTVIGKFLFVVLQRGGITIMLNSDEGKVQASNPNHRTNTDARWDAYLRVPSADVIHDEFRNRGVQIVRAIADAEYGFRDFEIEDLDGYILCIGSERCLDEAHDKNS